MTTPCELCGGTDRDLVLTGRDRTGFVSGTWDLKRCTGCGLVAMDPLPQPEEIGAFYSDSDYYAHKSSASTFGDIRPTAIDRFVLRHRHGYPPAGTNPIARAAALLLSPWLSRDDLPDWVGDGQALDIGCGVGAKLWRYQAFGWRVRGVELDDRAAEIGRSHGIDIFSGELKEAGFPDRSFDFVRMSHVVEHVRSPLTVLREVRRILTPAGRAWMALPNIDSYCFKKFGADWYQIDLPRHLYQFTPKTLQLMCEKAGLRVRSLRFESSKRMLLQSMQYAREERAEREGRQLHGKPIDSRRWLRRAVAPWVGALDRLGRGDTMICECSTA